MEEGMNNHVNLQDASGPPTTVFRDTCDIRKGQNVMLDGRPCKIVEVRHYTDQHGNVEKHFVGRDIFTNKKYEDSSPSTSRMEVPIIIHQEYELFNILDNEYAWLKYNIEGKNIALEIPAGELGVKIRTDFADSRKKVFCTVMSSCEEQVIVDSRSTEVPTDTKEQWGN